MSVFLGQPTADRTAPAAGCDCHQCPWYSGDAADPTIQIAPLCSGSNSDCSYCGCSASTAPVTLSRGGGACSGCPIRCGSRSDIDEWMSELGGTLEFDDVTLEATIPQLPRFIPQVDGSGVEALDAGLQWPAYAVGLRRVFSPKSHELMPKFDSGQSARESLGLPAPTKTVLTGYAEDPLVEAFWTRRNADRLVERIAAMEWDLILAPNYSIYGNWPRAEHLINMRRCLLIAEEFIRAGAPAVPNLYWFRLEDLQRWADWIAETEPPAIAINLQTVRENSNWDSWSVPGLHWLAANIPADLPIFITGLSRRDRIEMVTGLFGDRVTLISQNPAQYALHGAIMGPRGREDRKTRTPDAFASSVRYMSSLLPN